MWDPVIDVGKPSNRRSVLPPLSIAEFREKVGELHFTNGADREVVASIYERTLRSAFGGASKLMFNSCGWGPAAASSFAASLELCTRLETLDLEENALGDTGVCALAAALAAGAAPELKVLRLQRTDCGDAGLAAALGALAAAAPKLEVFAFNENEALGGEWPGALARAPLPALKYLSLESIAMGDAGVCAFAAAVAACATPQLTDLGMQRTGCGDAGLAALAGALAAGAPRLEAFDLSSNEVGDAEGLRALARAPLPALKRLLLCDIKLGDAGVCALADEIACPALEELFLNSVDAGDGGLEALGRALGRGALSELRLLGYCGNRASSQGKRTIAAARRPPVQVWLE